jgi:aminopeptidase N
MTLKVSFEPQKGLVKGTVTHVFTPLRRNTDSIIFDGIRITIREAMLNGKPVRYKATDSQIIVYPQAMNWGSTDSITFVYEATPRAGIYFIGWNDATGRARRQIWTQGQAIDNRAWIPMYDEMNDKYITETIITFDKDYQVLSNGNKISDIQNSDGTRTWHYRMTKPHAPYLLTLAIGKYEIEKRRSTSGIENNLYFYPEFRERVEPTYRMSTESMDFLENFIGVPYPWESYAQVMVQDFTFGAMENTTATTFGDFSFVDERGFVDRSYIATNVHELTHQWFGDYITARAQKHLWLQESFATFYPKYFFLKYNGAVHPDARKYFGKDAWQWNLRGEQNQALNASEKDKLPIVHPNSGSARIYPKGSSVIDMMMYVFGEEEVRRVIRHYLLHHSYANVETHDLYRAFQDTLGITPDWFFDQWIYRGGEPHYRVNYQDARMQNGRATVVNVEQIHEINELTGLFKMPVNFEVHYTDGSREGKTEWIDKAQQTVQIPNSGNKDIAFVLFDPGSRILKKVIFKKSFAELKKQALNAPNMIDRYDAVVAMKEEKDSIARDQALAEIFEKESFYAIRAEIATQFAARPNQSPALQILKKALADSIEDVRKAALNGMKIIPQELKQSVIRLLGDRSYVIITTALEKLSEQFPDGIPDYLDLTKNETGLYAQIKIKWLEIKAARGDKNAAASLADYAGMSFDFWTRRNAMASLKRINYMDEKVLANALDAAWNPNSRLAGNAVDMLNYFYQQAAWKQIILREWNSRNDWKSWQKDAWEKIMK